MRIPVARLQVRGREVRVGQAHRHLHFQQGAGASVFRQHGLDRAAGMLARIMHEPPATTADLAVLLSELEALCGGRLWERLSTGMSEQRQGGLLCKGA